MSLSIFWFSFENRRGTCGGGVKTEQPQFAGRPHNGGLVAGSCILSRPQSQTPDASSQATAPARLVCEQIYSSAKRETKGWRALAPNGTVSPAPVLGSGMSGSRRSGTQSVMEIRGTGIDGVREGRQSQRRDIKKNGKSAMEREQKRGP